MASSRTLSPPRPTRPSFFRSISASSSPVHDIKHDLFPQKDKPRLYVALYPRGGSHATSSYSSSMTCDSYHWALLVGPQTPERKEAGISYQLIHPGVSTISTSDNSYTTTLYEETDLSQQSQAQSQALLARITLAKVTDEQRVRDLLRSLPVSNPSTTAHDRHHEDSEDETGELHGTSTCLHWVKEAYRLLTTDGKCLRGYIGPDDWPEIEEVTRKYLKRKRRQGRFGDSDRNRELVTWNVDNIATWNFWENRETTN